MRLVTGLLVCAACLFGCADSPPGLEGGDGGTDTDTDTDTDSDTDTDTDVDTDSDSDADSDAGTDAGADSGTANACTETHELYLLWPDAVVTEPMAMGESEDPALFYIYTDSEDEGTAVATVEIPCDDNWYVWGIAQTGFGTPLTVPNTFYASLDGAAEFLWELQVDPFASDWVWNPGGTDGILWAPALEAGSHSITIRGGQEDWLSDLPKLGPLTLVNDAAWTPDGKGPLP